MNLRLLFLIFLFTNYPATLNAKIAGKGENTPTVQSAFGGAYYVRSIPSDDFGNIGKTQVVKVKNDSDEILDEYPVYMRGQLYLGWSPIQGKWCLIHLEPIRITNDKDYYNMGRISRMVFYMGGKAIHSYSGEDLIKIGLERSVTSLEHGIHGQFKIHGIKQVELTNRYALSIEKSTLQSKVPEELLFDITTGKLLGNGAEKK
jgi:hypothetical protein